MIEVLPPVQVTGMEVIGAVLREPAGGEDCPHRGEVRFRSVMAWWMHGEMVPMLYFSNPVWGYEEITEDLFALAARRYCVWVAGGLPGPAGP